MKASQKLFFLGFFLLIIDQLTKYAIRTTLQPNISIPILKNILHLTFAQNTGALFGSFKGTNQLLIWITLMAIGLILYLWDQLPQSNLSRISLTFILTGSIGNLIDRIILGYVTDFMDFRIWPVFNLADSLVTLGVIGLVIAILKGERKAPKKPKKKKPVRK